jgi:hypothetical protein
MNRKHVTLGASLIFAAGLLAGRTLFAVSPSSEAAVKVIFENPNVAVREITMVPGTQRAPRVRETDEVVLFCEEAHYRAVTADGKREPRDRKPGTVVFHSKGEQAPTLINDGKKPVHYFSLSLK